jgi:hypothetical protein
MTEQEFWQNLNLSDPSTFKDGNDATVSFMANLIGKKVDSREIAPSGISNRPFLLIPRQNVATQKTQYSLEESDCIRLLKEFPELRLSYDAKVPLKVSEREFWEEFLKKNLENRTEIFGGNNPLFIPYVTNENDYEDRYIHNQQQLLEPLSRQQLQGATDKKAGGGGPLLDVDFVRNTQMNDTTPEGYGTYQSQTDLFYLKDRLEAGLISQGGGSEAAGRTTGQALKEQEYNIKVRKIINKYNHNS